MIFVSPIQTNIGNQQVGNIYFKLHPREKPEFRGIPVHRHFRPGEKLDIFPFKPHPGIGIRHGIIQGIQRMITIYIIGSDLSTERNFVIVF